MVLGTANFCNEYRGTYINREECYDLLKYFEDHGGEMVDTAIDYGDSYNCVLDYISKNNSKLKVMVKIKYWNSLRYLDKYDIILCRIPETLKEMKETTKIKHIGLSIYYPHELHPDAKYISIPAGECWKPYIEVMQLHAKVFQRSTIQLNQSFPGVEKIIGVDNMSHLKEAMT